ncbi:MerR family transcriptional regulator [Noviherbaspirillum sp. L7-7A]|nr:MerR family transcriptional regulator [Noviherbaspirillum sp. L7-7A]
MHRTGVAARLAGLPVETLRVWERRYALSETERSAHGQRLYSAEQVRRLGLLKQLVDQGHPIGVLAGLPMRQLEEMTVSQALPEEDTGRMMRVALLGESIIRRLAAGGRDSLGLVVRASCTQLAQAETVLQDADADLLLVELSELDDSAVPRIVAARRACSAVAVVVLYRFCASATIRHLRAQGCLVARVPPELGELLLLCRAALANARPPLRERRPVPAPPRPRRFSDEALLALAGAANSVDCECPRHLADILMTVGSFERYSAQCASRNEPDAQLHQALQLAAGQAMAILEDAMERLARAEGLPLTPA